MRGTPARVPPLLGIGKKYKEDEIAKVIREGRGRMPNFAYLGQNVINALARFLATGKDIEFATPVTERVTSTT